MFFNLYYLDFDFPLLKEHTSLCENWSALVDTIIYSIHCLGSLSTYLESCGVADLITTCYGGRNRRVSEAFVKTGRPLVDLEAEMLNGQKLQVPAFIFLMWINIYNFCPLKKMKVLKKADMADVDFQQSVWELPNFKILVIWKRSYPQLSNSLKIRCTCWAPPGLPPPPPLPLILNS